jgi:hypothetical protein
MFGIIEEEERTFRISKGKSRVVIKCRTARDCECFIVSSKLDT